ncbi:MAG: GxxExxY protein [Chitinophagales bacterium]
MEQAEFPYGAETYQLIGRCMDVHNELGHGLLEIVYKSALEIELKGYDIPFEREKPFDIYYKGIALPHKFYADFIVHGNIIIEVKATAGIITADIAQTINYLKLSGCKLGLLVNFGRQKLEYKRIAL